MLSISKGEPWVFWPSSICDSFPTNPCNKLLDGNSSFTISMDISFSDSNGCLFSILPHYTALEVSNKTLQFIFSYDTNEVRHEFLNFVVNKQNRCKITLDHLKNKHFKILINRKNLLTLNLTNKKFKVEQDPHIIFGASNFPKNKVNLNYNNIELYDFKIKQDNKVLSHHNFKKFIFDKSYDITGNLNFLHKI